MAWPEVGKAGEKRRFLAEYLFVLLFLVAVKSAERNYEDSKRERLFIPDFKSHSPWGQQLFSPFFQVLSLAFSLPLASFHGRRGRQRRRRKRQKSTHWWEWTKNPRVCFTQIPLGFWGSACPQAYLICSASIHQVRAPCPTWADWDLPCGHVGYSNALKRCR